MKKTISSLLIMAMISSAPIAMAVTEATTSSTTEVKAPVWEEYVPEKYQNPRSFPSRGKNIAELSVGIVLTDLLITAPVGIPMVCHATTKMKNQGWYEKKAIFEKGLKEAENISNPTEKQAYYNNLLRECRMTNKKHEKQMKKIEKQQAKKKH